MFISFSIMLQFFCVIFSSFLSVVHGLGVILMQYFINRRWFGLPRFRTPRGWALCCWPPSSYQTGQPCPGRPCRLYWSTTEEEESPLRSSGNPPPRWPKHNKKQKLLVTHLKIIGQVTQSVCAVSGPGSRASWRRCWILPHWCNLWLHKLL